MHIPCDHLNAREVRRYNEERARRREQLASNHSVFRRVEPEARSARTAAIVVVVISVALMAVSIAGIVRQSL